MGLVSLCGLGPERDHPQPGVLGLALFFLMCREGPTAVSGDRRLYGGCVVKAWRRGGRVRQWDAGEQRPSVRWVSRPSLQV